MRSFNRSTLLFLSLIIMLAMAIPAGSYLYTKYNKLPTPLTAEVKSATTSNDVSTQKIVKEISELVELPTDEEPTIATITEVEKLKNQPFFKKAKNGDKVLVYQKNKKAYLYDPVAGKVLDIIPINTATPSAATKSTTLIKESSRSGSLP